ncbi:MAG: protein-L-isoaspartate O-methyltransferase [Pseudomonadota bacterium]
MDFSRRRKAMVDSQIRPNDVTDARLLDAFATTPREAFLPAHLQPAAYVEMELAVAPGRALPTARDHAKLLEALDLAEGDLVLDVACATGYSTAILAQVVDMVVAVEADEALAAFAEGKLAEHDIANAAVIVGPPAAGAASQGPFDAVVVSNGAVDAIPDALLGQLKDGGRLAAFCPADGVVQGTVMERAGDAFGRRRLFAASTRTFLDEFSAPPAFVF